MKKICNVPQDLANTTENNRLYFPPSKGKGYIQRVRLKSGIQLNIEDYTLQRPRTMELEPPFKPIGFGFRLSGHTRTYSAGQKTGWNYKPDQANFICCPDLENLTVNTGTERVVRVGMVMDFTQFYTFAQGGTERLPFQLNNPLTGAYSHEGPITPAMRAAIFQIFNCPYQGWAKSFFMEGKVLELIAHKIGQIEPDAPRKPDVNSLPSPDVERIREAARLLTGNLETSPDLNQLARSVGMCRSKLHRCFRMVYGITPFEYLRNRRLETAMDFLMDGRMNVAEAAFAVGYSCPSHFSKAFKKYFGHLPSKNFFK
ncbi:AraC family transcriptional regulator [uncultured Desulfobacter sp.]|uniref:helix-turn-helix transcriptional regulator n=1 Tax=uncultured Desulfobacter sp. TaxID=240139 RepID=UPI002AA7C560|nr:AraC family transcriptional regulator [uncultured Desulfobacter sp.]